MKIKISNHAIDKQFILFNSSKKYNIIELKNQIRNDINSGDKIITRFNDMFSIYKTDKSQYLVQECSDKLYIFSIFNLSDNIEKNNFKVIFKITKRISNTITKKIIDYMYFNDYILIKQQGMSRFVLINHYLCHIKTDEYSRLNKKKYFIYKINQLTDIKNKKDLDSLKEKYFQHVNENEWLIIVNQLGLLDLLYDNTEQSTDSKWNEPEVTLYKSILNGDTPKFPSRFWQDELIGKNHESATLLTMYMFEEVLKWRKVDIYNKLRKTTFQKNKLGGMLRIVYDDNIYQAINEAYPNDFLPWRFKHIPCMGYWRLENNQINLKQVKEYLLEQLEHEGIKVNTDNLLSYNWETLLDRYYMLRLLTITFNSNLQIFFKEFFNVDIDSQRIESYKYKFKFNANAYLTIY
jgi:transcriptional regulator